MRGHPDYPVGRTAACGGQNISEYPGQRLGQAMPIQKSKDCKVLNPCAPSGPRTRMPYPKASNMTLLSIPLSPPPWSPANRAPCSLSDSHPSICNKQPETAFKDENHIILLMLKNSQGKKKKKKKLSGALHHTQNKILTFPYGLRGLSTANLLCPISCHH